MKTALVLGAGGFIGSHLVKRLKSEGYWVRGVDLKYPEFSKSEADEFLIYDLRNPRNVEAVMRLDAGQSSTQNIILEFSYTPIAYSSKVPFDEVYQLAADMGGAGYIFTGEHDADVMHNSATINLNVCQWAAKYKVGKVFYSSSACMYPAYHQGTTDVSLSENMAYPAEPDSEYGWEKLFSERLYLAYARNYGLNVRIARFHNIYGPEGTYDGGREKAPAAICRKVIDAKEIDPLYAKAPLYDEPDEIWENEIENHTPKYSIDIWGTGEQTRSFLYIDDCIYAVRLLMQSDFKEPINIGSEEMVTINQLADLAIKFSGKSIIKKHIEGPVGVQGRNSNNDLIRSVLGWEPKYTLEQGLLKTFNWIKSRYDV